MLSFLGICSMIIIITTIFLFLIALAFTIPDRIQCHAKADKMGFESNYTISTDCMIKVKGTYVPIDNYRVVTEVSK